MADRRLVGRGRRGCGEHHRRFEVDLALRLGELGEFEAAVEELVRDGADSASTFTFQRSS